MTATEPCAAILARPLATSVPPFPFPFPLPFVSAHAVIAAVSAGNFRYP